jgi:hypothetical protein
MRDGRSYLSFLSDFWTAVWSDSAILSTAIGTSVEILNRFYLQAVRMSAPDYIDELPLFREDFWQLVYFAQRDRVSARRYRLPNPCVELPYLYNTVFDPTVILREGTDYTLAQNTDGSTDIVMGFEPFENARMPIRDLGDQKQISFFAPKIYTDEQDLYKLYGHMVKVVRPTSEQYRQLVKGLMFIKAHGPILHPLNAGLALAAGYPVSRDFDTVLGITNDLSNYYVTTAKGYTYAISLLATLSVVPGSSLRPLSSFIEDIRVMDWQSDPEWWKGGPGNTDPSKRVVSMLPPELVPEMNDTLRDDVDTIDYLFDTYLKYNILGLRLNTLALGNFNAVQEFYDTLYEVKPSWLAPYTNAFFKASEVWDAPSDLVEMVSTIELVTDTYGTHAERWHFPRGPRLNARLRLGVTKQNMSVIEGTAYDRPLLTGAIEPIGRNMLSGGPVRLGSLRKLGTYPDGAVFEKVTLNGSIEPVDTYTFGSNDRCQIVAQVEADLGDPTFFLGDPYDLGTTYGLGYGPHVSGDTLVGM